MGLLSWGSTKVVLSLVLQMGKLGPRAHSCQRWRRCLLAGSLVLLAEGGTSCRATDMLASVGLTPQDPHPHPTIEDMPRPSQGTWEVGRGLLRG